MTADANRLREETLALYETFAAHCSTRRTRSSPRCGRAAQRESGSPIGSRTSTASNASCSPIWCPACATVPVPTLLVAREVRNFAEYLQNDMAHEESTLLSAAALPDEP